MRCLSENKSILANDIQPLPDTVKDTISIIFLSNPSHLLKIALFSFSGVSHTQMNVPDKSTSRTLDERNAKVRRISDLLLYIRLNQSTPYDSVHRNDLVDT